MNVDVVVNGRPWKVALAPAEQAGTFTVTIKGKSRLVDASWIDTDTVSLIDGGASREIRLHQRDDSSAVGVEFGGKLFEAVVQKGLREPFSSETPAKKAPGALSAAAIKAPMPGRVMRVLVAVGDRVTARQGVVVVEAMKMENELRSPRDGTVTDIGVASGSVVEAGAVLVVIGD